MGLAVAEKKPIKKRSERQISVSKDSKLARNKVPKRKSFPWKLVFGAVAIIGLMTFLSNPIDPNSIKNVSSSNVDKSGLSGFSLEK